MKDAGVIVAVLDVSDEILAGLRTFVRVNLKMNFTHRGVHHKVELARLY